MNMVVSLRVDRRETVYTVTHVIDKSCVCSAEHHLRTRDHIAVDPAADLDEKILDRSVIQRCRRRVAAIEDTDFHLLRHDVFQMFLYTLNGIPGKDAAVYDSCDLRRKNIRLSGT